MYLHSFYMYGSFLCLHVCITYLHCLNGPEECILFSETWVTDASEPLDGCLELKLGTLNALNCLALSPDPYGMFLTTSSVGNQDEWLLALLSLWCPQASLNNSCREVAHSWHWKFHLLTYGIWESLCLPIWSTCIQILIFFLILIILSSIRFLYSFFHTSWNWFLPPSLFSPIPLTCPWLKHLLPYYSFFDFSRSIQHSFYHSGNTIKE